MKKLTFILWMTFVYTMLDAKSLGNPWGMIYDIESSFNFSNISPILEELDDVNMNEGDTVFVELLACDGDNDPITLHASGLPGFVNLTDNGNGRGTLAFLPINDSGRYPQIKVYVKDNQGGADTVFFNLVVNKVIYRINAGGISEPDLPIAWELDKQTNPSVYLDSSSYNHTTGSNLWQGRNDTRAPDNIFGGNRYNLYSDKLMKWNFPVSEGLYRVNLYFAEKSSFTQGAGYRKFKVLIEDQEVLNNFDIYAEAGMGALKKTFIIPVNDDTLNILLDSILNYPQINGIEIIALEDTFPVVSKDVWVVEELLFPNPATNRVTMQFPEYIRGVVSIILYNAKGELCYTRTQQVGCGNSLQLDLGALDITEGVYYLSISSDYIKKVFRMVKFD